MTKNLDNIISEGVFTSFKNAIKPLAQALTIASALYLGACGGDPVTTTVDGGNGDSGVTYVSDIATGSVTPSLNGVHSYDIGDDITTSFEVPEGTEKCSAELSEDSGDFSFVVGPEACTSGTTYTTTIPTDGAPAGGYNIILTASNPDDSKTVTIDDVTLTEAPVNQAPIMDRIFLTRTNVGSNLAGVFFAHDPEGENLNGNWTITSDYPGAAVGNSGELYSFTFPGLSELGNVYTFTPEVCDSQGACTNSTVEARIDPYEMQATLVYGSGSNITFRMPNLIADKFAQHIPGCPAPLADDTDGSADDQGTPYEANQTDDLNAIMAEWTNLSVEDKETFCFYNNNCDTLSATLDQVASDGSAIAYQLKVSWHGD